MIKLEKITLNINGALLTGEAEPNWTLLTVLREVFGLTGTKCGCNTGDCGGCRVIIDGKAVNSCTLQVKNLSGKQIKTIESLSQEGKLHPIQQAFIDVGAVQCGYCIPGMVMSTKALLDKNLSPSREEIKVALSGNLCRCTGYIKIIDAVELAAKRMREDEIK